jgi:hypothetical protein
MGNGQWAMGNGQWAMGNGQWAMGNEFRAAQVKLLVRKPASRFTIDHSPFTIRSNLFQRFALKKVVSFLYITV